MAGASAQMLLVEQQQIFQEIPMSPVCAGSADSLNSNVYDVTRWQEGNAHEDIGAVINSIIAHIKQRQNCAEHGLNRSEGKPGAVIYIPPGDYHLKTQILVDISYLRIEGSGHGFISSSIRFNTEKSALEQYQDIWPGGSRILVDLNVTPEQYRTQGPEAGAAILVKREGMPRISSVEFSGFCIDGLHFTEMDGKIDENSYLNGKTGIYIGCANDSFCFRDMGFIYLEHGLTICEADALSVDNNFIAECGSCVELRKCGQASRIANNLMGAGYNGHTIYAENHGGLLVTGNNVFPRGRSSVHFKNVSRSTITSNRLHSFYSGMVILSGKCCENLIGSNHLLRDPEPWEPMKGYNNNIEDDYGLIHIEGNNNTVTGNHISSSIGPDKLIFCECSCREDQAPVMIRIAEGHGNYVASNHIVATDPDAGKKHDDTAREASECFATQVEAMTSITNLKDLEKCVDVLIDETAGMNSVIYSSRKSKTIDNGRDNMLVTMPG